MRSGGVGDNHRIWLLRQSLIQAGEDWQARQFFLGQGGVMRALEDNIALIQRAQVA